MASIDDLDSATYLLLTTFRKDGTPVATPVWAARDGDALLVGTGTQTGKVKRVRANGRVTLQRCDMRGRPAQGAPVVEAQAALVADEAGRHHADEVLRRKYGLQYRIATLFRPAMRADSPARAVLRIVLV